MKTNTFLLFVSIILAVLSGSLLKENATQKAILASQTCDNLVIVIPREELRQCGYQDGDIFLKISKEK